MNRRDVLKGLPAAWLAACAEERVYGPARVEAAADWEGLGEPDDTLFPLGIQSGEPRTDSLLLWTKYTGEAALEVVVAVWDGSAWAEHATLPAPLDAGHEDAGVTHIAVTGLPVDAPVAFQFRDADGKRSRVGHTRTAPPADTNRTVRFGAVSCCSYGGAPFACLSNTMARGDVDFFVWNGDTVYLDSANNLGQMRAIWERSFREDGFRDVMSRAPGLFTWDDHEVDNDWGIPGMISEEREQQAKGVYYEYVCVQRPAEDKHWRSYRIGCVEVFVLDGRGEHDLEAEEYLSEEQFQWLLDGLAASDATWKVIVNSVPIAMLPDVYNIEPVLYEHWNAYPAQRAALVEHIASNAISGVLFVSGDVHHPALYRVDAEGPGNALLDLFVGPGGSSLNPLGRVIMDQAQYVWSDAFNNAARFELRPEGIGHVMWVDNDDVVMAEAWFDVHGAITWLDWVPQPA